MLLGYLGNQRNLRKLGTNKLNHEMRYTEINLKSSTCEDSHKWQFKWGLTLFEDQVKPVVYLGSQSE